MFINRFVLQEDRSIGGPTNLKLMGGCTNQRMTYYEIRQSKINSRWVAGPIGQMNRQPSVWCSKYIFFRLFISLGHSKLFTFIFVFFYKNKQIDWKYFCKEFCKKSWKKIILWTSDAWLTIHLSHRPSDRAWIYLRLTNFNSPLLTLGHTRL